MPSDETQRPATLAPLPRSGRVGWRGGAGGRRGRAGAFPAFRPRWPWIGADLQTLRDVLVPDSDLHDPGGVEELEFPMPDGTGDRLTGLLEHPRERSGRRPLAVLVHGLTGCADSRYVRRAAGRLLDAGYRTLRLNLRGAGPCRRLCREQYHSGRSQDLAAVIAQLPEALRADGLVLVGWSLGANMLLKGLAEFGTAHPILGAVAVSAPIQLAEAANRMRSPRNWLYHRWLLGRMKVEAAGAPVTLAPEFRAALAKVRDIIDFDERLTAPINGYAGASDYYSRCSAIRFLPEIPVPTLVIHALDDPWIPGAAYRDHDWEANPNLMPLLPERGGHVGFHGAGSRVWSDDCMLQFLDRLSAGDGQPALRRWATSTAK